MNDYYALLGVDRFVSPEDLRHAYRAQILAMHPDQNQGSALACKRAREIIEAYHVLSNSVSRRDYDLGIGYPAAHLATRTAHRRPISFQWIPKLMLIAVFFAVVAGLVYGVMLAADSRSMVFRPNLQAVITAPDPASPVILGKRIPRLDADVAREDQMNLASNIVDCVCHQTALYAEAQAHPGSRFFTEALASL